MHKTLDFVILLAIFVIPLYSLSIFTTSKFIKWCSKIDDAIRFELFVLTSKLIKFVVSHGLKLRALTCFHLLTVAEVLPTVQTSQVLVFTG